MTLEDVPELVPARMVNEFSYCPRLFFLEWVQARFADSVDTVEGRDHHRRVDTEQGAPPLPEDGELSAARGMDCFEFLGVTTGLPTGGPRIV